MTTAGQKSDVRHFFNRNDDWKGEFYREVDNPFGQMIVRRKEYVLRLFRDHIDNGNANVFDAGCGPGEYLGEFAGSGYMIYGMDASEEMLRSAGETLRRRGLQGQPRLIQGDIEHIPVRSGSFDAVLCIGVLSYLERDDRALVELRRLLRPGGHLILNVRNLNALTSVHYSLRLKLRYLRSHGWGKLRSAVSMATHTHEGGWKSKAYNIGRLEKEMESTGFSRVDGLTFGYEFKVLAKLGLSGRSIVRLEALFESLMLAMPFRALRHSGWGYVGVFRNEPAA